MQSMTKKGDEKGGGELQHKKGSDSESQDTLYLSPGKGIRVREVCKNRELGGKILRMHSNLKKNPLTRAIQTFTSTRRRIVEGKENARFGSRATL